MKRVFALLLCIMMCLSMLPVSAFADEDYTVSFVTQYGTAPDTQIVEEGSKATKVELHGNTGNHCFRGWLLDDELFEFNTPITGNITLTAKWGEHLNSTTTTNDSCTESKTVTLECDYCGDDFTVTLPPRGHVLQFVQETTPTCTKKGNTAYYKCTECNLLFSDEQGKTEISEESVVLSEIEHDWEHHNEVPATCATEGTEAYDECTVCHLKNPESAPLTIPATGKHEWVEVISDIYLREPASGSNRASYYRSCKECKIKSSSEYFYVGAADCSHNFVENICTICQAKRASVKVNVNGNGIAKINNVETVSGIEVFVAGGSVTIDLQAGSNASLTGIVVNGEKRDALDVPFTVTAVLGEPCIVIEATFASRPADAIPSVVSSSVDNNNAIYTRIDSLEDTLALQTGVNKDSIYRVVRNIIPCWNQDVSYPMTEEEVEAAGGLPIIMPYPEEIEAGDRSQYNYSIYHYSSTGWELLNSSPASDGVHATAYSFSPFVLFAALRTPTSSGMSGGTGTITVVKPDPPKIRIAPIIDEGSTQTGAILDVNPSMEYMRKGSSEGYKQITGTKLDDLAAGTYYVRYKATSASEASETTTAKIEEYYTVRLKLKDGYGTYEILSGNEEYDDDIYLVRKGEDLQIKFKPANHYWLYAIYVNDVYVGASNVKTNYTLYNVNKKTTIVYWFSASSSSPKTGEDNQIFLWAAEEVISLLGMATIVYYLFRRKEQY